MSAKPEQPEVYGLMAEFDDPGDLVEATRHAYDRGYRMMEAYSPFPVDGLADALGFHSNKLPAVVLMGGLAGGIGGFFMQWYSAVVSFPIDVGGRPFNSWPAFIPITFEMTILGAALSAVFGMLAFNGLPRPHHPVFNVPSFALASRNRFFLCLQARDPLFEVETARKFLEDHQPKTISVVPA
jgi:Protein of unknown function (DUF3341)